MTEGPIFPALLPLADVALLLLRWLLAVLFGFSGWSHLTKPRARGQSIGMSPPATAVLGGVELLASVLLVIGLWDQLAALALLAVMGGALFKKAFVWKSGFWGSGSQGWFYDLLYAVCALVILTTAGGRIGL